MAMSRPKRKIAPKRFTFSKEDLKISATYLDTYWTYRWSPSHFFNKPAGVEILNARRLKQRLTQERFFPRQEIHSPPTPPIDDVYRKISSLELSSPLIPFISESEIFSEELPIVKTPIVKEKKSPMVEMARVEEPVIQKRKILKRY